MLIQFHQSYYYTLIIIGAMEDIICNTPLGAVIFMAISALGIEIEINL